MGKRKAHFRVHATSFSWVELTTLFLGFGLLAAVPGLAYSQDWRDVLSPYAGWYLLYCLIVAVGFALLASWQRYRTFDKPLRALSTAAERVASGDYSVYLQPVHRPERYDYLDAMFANFNTMVAELNSIETLRGDFVANVSHEFKRPLAIIRSYSEALQQSDLEATTRATYLATINTAATDLAELVSNILRLNKLETQISQPEHQSFDLVEQLTQVIFASDPLLESYNLELEVDMPERLQIIGDPDLLKVVWNNLLANAIKFTPDNGSIHLNVSNQHEHVTVSISDTGIGMNDQTRAHMFQKFYQGDRSHAELGNGLGLAMVAQILKLVEGQLEVQSELGQGSTFTIRLPR
ncbi:MULTISPECIES: HAMP domain-containing sensor histidine kinase [Lacticaseibacillus]|uniref:histidine kinase n=1 Tax=Lacticaseibacillus thailandensis DSM 22698 = JCM 13996 TaxID=1423810 RepID=A0A0R2CA96_9LACO|nr:MULTISPECIES: HAMP domain-containing sensor histidine kinase [Lacticaseibacillus]KRM86932.1 two component sensor transduction histidine kinase [Lacticaseibacillus thailandensis DSM 22698 = JCM 13996]QVI34293.1 HAMP domain-containing histidine kinase [Lacticaseibacillus chiayiensis]